MHEKTCIIPFFANSAELGHLIGKIQMYDCKQTNRTNKAGLHPNNNTTIYLQLSHGIATNEIVAKTSVINKTA